MSDLPNPINRYEKYLNAIATGNSDDLPTPTTREEVFLDYIAKNGGGTGGGDVTGVKGNAEGTYRRGNVNLTPTHLGLGNVDNTSDLDKPVSTAQQTALDGKVDKVVGKGLSENDYTDADKAIVDGVTSALAGKVDKVTGKGLSTNDYDDTAKGIVDGVTTALAGKVSTTSIGSANGVAELDANGKVPSAQLPSYVDDVLEYADLAHFPATGETGKIYIAEDTNKTYRWSGSNYAEISESLALGETSSTAYAGNKGKANADAIAAIKDGTNIDSFGDVETALAGKASTNDLGDKSNLTTTDKSSCVGAINEVNWKAGTFGTYTISNATDIKDFIKKLITQADADLASKPAYMLFNIFAVYSNVDVFYGTIERQENHAYAYSLSRAHGNYIYQGYYSITADSLTFYEFMTTNKSATVVNIDSTYDAGTDWNIVKQGNICVMNMRNLKDIPVGSTVIGIIPVGFRPEQPFYEFVYIVFKDIHLGFRIGENGEITCDNRTGAAISDTIFVNRNVTYFTA